MALAMSGADIVRTCGKAEEKSVSSGRRNERLAGEGGTVKCALIVRVAAISDNHRCQTNEMSSNMTKAGA